MQPQSLKKRILRLQLISTSIALIISGAILSIDNYFYFKGLEINKVKLISEIMERNLVPCLSFSDKNECNRLIKTLSTNDDVLNINVYKEDGSLFTSFSKNNDTSTSSKLEHKVTEFSFSLSNNLLDSVIPVIENQTIEGYLKLTTEFNLFKKFGFRISAILFIIAIVSIFVFYVISSVLQKDIYIQINNIINFLKQITTFKNYKERINITSSKNQIVEFKALTDSFNDMITQIEVRDEQLQQYNNNLEEMVKLKIKEIDEERIKTQQSAQLAALGEMTGGIAHEINNPLMIIAGTVSILKKKINDPTMTDEKKIELLSTIKATVERVSKIIKGMRNISRQSDNEDKSQCSFDDLLTDVLSIASEKFKNKNIELRIVMEKDDSTRPINIFRVQISQVLVNLLNNAYDAILEFDYKERWVEVKYKIQNNDIYIFVTDSGNGIPENVREKIFNPFFTTKPIGKGTGIGLSISKSIIEKNSGGKFEYDSSSPNTSFIIFIPNVVVSLL